MLIFRCIKELNMLNYFKRKQAEQETHNSDLDIEGTVNAVIEIIKTKVKI